MLPKITIVIATYNSEKTLAVAMESVLNQTFQVWVCLVVDGASTDSTVSIVEEFIRVDKRFRLISEPDKGIYDAFNKGWRNAMGEWVLYLGSDDKLTPGGIDALMSISTTTEAIVSGSILLVKPDGSIKKWKSEGYDGNHQAKMTRRALLEKFGGYDTDYRICADTEFHVRLKNAGCRVVNIDDDIAYFTMAGVSSKFSGLFIQFKERYSIYSKDKSVKNPLLKTFRIVTFNFCALFYRRLLKIMKR